MAIYKNSCRVCGKPALPGDRLALSLTAIRHRGCGHRISPHLWAVAPDGVSLLYRGEDDGDDRLDAPAVAEEAIDGSALTLKTVRAQANG